MGAREWRWCADDDRQVRQLIPHAGHRSDIANSQQGQPSLTNLAPWRGAAHDCLEAHVIEPRAHEPPVAASCPNDRHRIRLVDRGVAAQRISVANFGQCTVEDKLRMAGFDDGGDFAVAETRIDACRHGPDTDDGLVRNRMVDGIRQPHGHHIPPANAMFVDQQGGQSISALRPLGEGDPSPVDNQCLARSVIGDYRIEEIERRVKLAGNRLHQNVSTPRATVPVSRP